MAVNLDPTQGAAAPGAGRLDRHDAEARQGRWMLELERAMFSSSAKSPRGAAPRQEGDAPAPHDVPAQNGAVAVSAPASQRTAGLTGRAPVEARGDGAQPGAESGARGADGAGGQDPAAQRNLVAARDAGAAVIPVHGHAPALVQGGAAFAGMQEAAAVAAPARAVPGAAPAAGSDDASPIRTVQALRQTTAPPAAFPQGAAPQADTGAPDVPGPEEAEQPDAGAASTADPAEFDKRLMHLFSGPDGMHAYIRDAELGAARMRSVAAALSAELAAGGRSLTSLTVNGKRIDLADRDASDGLAAGDDLAGSRHYPQSLTLARKEPTE